MVAREQVVLNQLNARIHGWVNKIEARLREQTASASAFVHVVSIMSVERHPLRVNALTPVEVFVIDCGVMRHLLLLVDNNLQEVRQRKELNNRVLHHNLNVIYVD